MKKILSIILGCIMPLVGVAFVACDSGPISPSVPGVESDETNGNESHNSDAETDAEKGDVETDEDSSAKDKTDEDVEEKDETDENTKNEDEQKADPLSKIPEDYKDVITKLVEDLYILNESVPKVPKDVTTMEDGVQVVYNSEECLSLSEISDTIMMLVYFLDSDYYKNFQITAEQDQGDIVIFFQKIG